MRSNQGRQVADPAPLTDEQSRIADDVERFLADRSGARNVMTVFGLAGTGKTHLLAELARRHPLSRPCAPTGRAASVLRGRVGRDVETVHSLIYDYLGSVEDDRQRQRPVFGAKSDAGINGITVFLDEAPMVGARLAEDLLDTGARVVAFGDPGQLRPVADDPYFDRPDRTLREIHRQALDSPIIRQAHAIRNTGTYRTDGDGFRVIGDATDEDHLSTDIVLCYKNATRVALNRRRRRLHGMFNRIIRAGEPVMCLRNDYALRVFNGEIYTVATDRRIGEDIAIEVRGQVVTIPFSRIEGVDPDFESARYGDTGYPMALAYAATCHKYQGSESESVMVVDEVSNRDDRVNWLYTAFTRARSRAIIVRRW